MVVYIVVQDRSSYESGSADRVCVVCASAERAQQCADLLTRESEANGLYHKYDVQEHIVME